MTSQSGPDQRPIVRLDPLEAPTEGRNPRTTEIDLLPTLGMLQLINDEDALVAHAVRAALPELARVVDLGVEALRSGHRIHYFGAGTSGRLGVLDVAELLPTYTFEPGRVVAHHAGGTRALMDAVEDIEDDGDLGAADASGVHAGDLVVGLTASGRSPYVLGALRRSAAAGAATVLVSSNPQAPYGREVDVDVAVDTGPEVIAGSTRMKAGTAQKLVLNAFSTAVMVRLGRTYSNLMVHMTVTNAKLRGRLVTILMDATGEDQRTCELALISAGGDCKVALVCLLAGVPPEQAAAALDAAEGVVRRALSLLDSSSGSPSRP
ncbi:MAG: N-acetylmuramic acid 6-phosphate etherase [Jiangellaceae bacterium]